MQVKQFGRIQNIALQQAKSESENFQHRNECDAQNDEQAHYPVRHRCLVKIVVMGLFFRIGELLRHDSLSSL